MARAGQALASLRIRLLLLVFLALAPALGLILYSSLDRRRADADQVRANAGQLANLVAAQLQQAIEGAHQTLIPLARIWGSPSGDLAEIDAESCSSFLADLLAQNALYLNFGLIARNGDLLCSGIPPGGPVNLEDRRYFQEAVRTRAFAIGDYQIGRVTGQGSLNAGYPITGADGQVRGVVFAAIDLTAISQLPARAQLPEGSFMNFTDRNGAILARYPDSERWTGTPAERNPPWQSIQQQPAGGTDEVRNVEGVRSLIAFVPLIGPSGAADAYVTVGIPASTAYADANADLTRNLVGLGVVAVLALGLAGLSAQALIVRPTRALTGATGRMAAGDLHARVGPPYGGGELGHLARAFDVMAASLEAQVEEIRQTASAVRASEARFSNIVSAAPVAVITTDDRQRIQLFNAAAEQMFGYAAAEVLGQQLDLLIPERFRGAHRERHLPGFAAGPETGRRMAEERAEVCGRRKDGSEFPAGVSISKVMVNGSPIFTAMVEDVTVRRAAETEIRLLNENLEQRVAERTSELEAANRELEAFSYSVSHDLRAPLRAIDGFSRLLVEEYARDLPAEAQRYLGVVRGNAQQMGRLIDDLLAFSRTGRQPLETRPVQPERIVREVLDALRQEQQGRQVNVLIGDLPACIADPALLKHVYMNLISNALKYTRSREVAEIRVGCSLVNGEPVYTVSDNGVGFDMQYADKLFGVFQRLHRAEEYEGSGVGLAIVQRIVARHGGRVWAEAEVDKGATLFFTLGAAHDRDTD